MGPVVRRAVCSFVSLWPFSAPIFIYINAGLPAVGCGAALLQGDGLLAGLPSGAAGARNQRRAQETFFAKLKCWLMST